MNSCCTQLKIWPTCRGERAEEMVDLAMEAARADALISFNEAIRRNLFRPNLASWEVADLLQYTARLAIFDASRADGFDAFREQWIPLIGQGDESDALDWLVPIYLSVVTSPSIAPESRRELANTAMNWL